MEAKDDFHKWLIAQEAQIIDRGNGATIHKILDQYEQFLKDQGEGNKIGIAAEITGNLIILDNYIQTSIDDDEIDKPDVVSLIGKTIKMAQRLQSHPQPAPLVSFEGEVETDDNFPNRILKVVEYDEDKHLNSFWNFQGGLIRGDRVRVTVEGLE